MYLLKLAQYIFYTRSNKTFINYHLLSSDLALWLTPSVSNYPCLEHGLKDVRRSAVIRVILLTLVMLHKLRCHAHFKLSANQTTWSRLLIQIYMLNGKQCRSRSFGFWEANWSGSTLFAKAGYIQVQQDKVKSMLQSLSEKLYKKTSHSYYIIQRKMYKCGNFQTLL